MTISKLQPSGGSQSTNLPLFLVTLAGNEKSPNVFKLNFLSHVVIQVQAYRAQPGLTQCYNCQKFGHVWANCKQPPRCLGRGGGQKDCPEKGNEESTPTCCYL